MDTVTNNVYARARADNTIIDAQDVGTCPPHNEYALAHLANHPSGTIPNVIAVPFDFIKNGLFSLFICLNDVYQFP